jgi:hypothetical protein
LPELVCDKVPLKFEGFYAHSHHPRMPLLKNGGCSVIPVAFICRLGGLTDELAARSVVNLMSGGRNETKQWLDEVQRIGL